MPVMHASLSAGALFAIPKLCQGRIADNTGAPETQISDVLWTSLIGDWACASGWNI